MVIRSLLGVQIVGQSWTLLQEEPVDYAVYVAQQEALQVCYKLMHSKPLYMTRRSNTRSYIFLSYILNNSQPYFVCYACLCCHVDD